MKPNIGKVEIHEEHWKLFTNTNIADSYTQMVLVLLAEDATVSIVKPAKVGQYNGVAYGIFDVVPDKNMTEIWVCVGSERSHKRDYVVPLLRLLPPEGNNYVMEAGQHYTFKVWVRFGEAKIEEAQA